MSTPANPHLATALRRAGVAPGEARRVAVLVHGRDQDETLMEDVAARLDLPDVAYVLPVAAQRSWYPGRYFDPLDSLEPHLSWSLDAIDRALADAHARGVPDEWIVLGGFSQGACLIAEHLARRGGPRSYAGVAVLTGSLLGARQERASPTSIPDTPMLFTCARDDAWIPIADARDTAARFAAGGARTTFLELDDAVHHVSDRAVAALRTLISAA